MSASGKERVASAVPPKIILGNRGIVRFIERIWLLWEESRPLCGAANKAQ
jgi:hypothetical protein